MRPAVPVLSVVFRRRSQVSCSPADRYPLEELLVTVTPNAFSALNHTHPHTITLRITGIYSPKIRESTARGSGERRLLGDNSGYHTTIPQPTLAVQREDENKNFSRTPRGRPRLGWSFRRPPGSHSDNHSRVIPGECEPAYCTELVWVPTDRCSVPSCHIRGSFLSRDISPERYLQRAHLASRSVQ